MATCLLGEAPADPCDPQSRKKWAGTEDGRTDDIKCMNSRRRLADVSQRLEEDHIRSMLPHLSGQPGSAIKQEVTSSGDAASK